MRLLILLSSLSSLLLIGCAGDKKDLPIQIEKTDIVKEPLFSYVDFRIENYDVDTLSNYKVTDAFFNRYIKGNDAFRINYNNPKVNSATINYYVVDTLVSEDDITLLIILEVANTKLVGSTMTALILDGDDNFKTSSLLALTEENDAWSYYWRSYIKNDTLHRLSTGMGDPDTTCTKFLLNGFKRFKLISKKL